MSLHPVHADILRKFQVQLHHLTLNAIIQINKFIWVVTSCGGCPTVDVFAVQFGCITFHPNRYGGRVRLTRTMRNKWTSDWANNWFYCKVPSEQVADVQGKGNYPLRSTMALLDYLTDSPFECDPGDVNMAAFMDVASVIRGRDAVGEFLACGICRLVRAVSLRWRGKRHLCQRS
jgi:hypothetical protein